MPDPRLVESLAQRLIDQPVGNWRNCEIWLTGELPVLERALEIEQAKRGKLRMTAVELLLSRIRQKRQHAEGLEQCITYMDLLAQFKDEVNWLEDRGRFQRFSVGPEQSVWVCSECDHIADPDDEPEDNGCICPNYQQEGVV